MQLKRRFFTLLNHIFFLALGYAKAKSISERILLMLELFIEYAPRQCVFFKKAPG